MQREVYNPKAEARLLYGPQPGLTRIAQVRRPLRAGPIVNRSCRAAARCRPCRQAGRRASLAALPLMACRPSWPAAFLCLAPPLPAAPRSLPSTGGHHAAPQARAALWSVHDGRHRRRRPGQRLHLLPAPRVRASFGCVVSVPPPAVGCWDTSSGRPAAPLMPPSPRPARPPLSLCLQRGLAAGRAGAGRECWAAQPPAMLCAAAACWGASMAAAPSPPTLCLLLAALPAAAPPAHGQQPRLPAHGRPLLHRCRRRLGRRARPGPPLCEHTRPGRRRAQHGCHPRRLGRRGRGGRLRGSAGRPAAAGGHRVRRADCAAPAGGGMRLG